MHRRAFLALLLLAASALFAEDEFTITPAVGSAAGGSVVTIKGPFAPEWHYGFYFDNVPAKSATRVDAGTFTVVTPPHAKGVTRVSLFEYDFGLYTDMTFTYVDAATPAMDRVLIPLFTPPVHGALGSEFHTDFHAFNRSEEDVEVYGLTPVCILSACPEPNYSIPLTISPGKVLPPVTFTGGPGRFVYLPAGALDDLGFNLRAHDVSRAELNFGTEIPIVRDRDMTLRRLSMSGIPADPQRFRNTLRIYGLLPTTVRVGFVDAYGVQRDEYKVELQPGRNEFEPAYAMVNRFPTFPDGEALTLTLDMDDEVFKSPIWAFVSITNNETQVITTITPH